MLCKLKETAFFTLTRDAHLVHTAIIFTHTAIITILTTLTYHHTHYSDHRYSASSTVLSLDIAIGAATFRMVPTSAEQMRQALVRQDAEHNILSYP